MKKSNNKDKKAVLFRNIKYSLVFGLCAFVTISLASVATYCIFYFLHQFGFITENNFRIIWMFAFAIVCTAIGSVLSIIAIHFPIKKMTSLLRAMEKIANGDFSVRLTQQKKYRRLTKKTVDMFNNMACHLERTETLSHDFINNFSHEFKTPIASINGFAKLLKNSKLSDEEKNDYLDIIIQESERLSNLSINILTLSKLEQQTIITDKKEYNISEQIRIITGALYPKWSQKNLDIIFDGEDISTNANKEMLGQVWVNLLDNAIKFSPENKSIHIRIKKDTDFIQVSIKNYGKTISKEQAERIFDKFYQGDESRSTTGNGLGLPMVKRILELHGGTISLDQNETDKTAFLITLPVQYN